MKHFNLLINFRWFATIIFLITLAVGQIWGGYNLSEFTDKNFSGLSAAWSSSGSANALESASPARGIQWTKNQSTTFTATGFSNVTSVHVWVAKSGSGKGSVKIQENTTAIKTISTFNTTSTEESHKWGAASPYTGTVKVVVSATASSIYMKKMLVTFLTTITLNANGGATNRTATIDNDSTSCTSFTACTYTGKTCTGYWTASSGGTKILDADGSLAGANITVSTVPYTSGGKWVYAGATLTLYAQWESAASCDANPEIGTASLNSSFSLSSIPLQCSVSSDGGTGCTITDAGFVYVSGGDDPTISDNKTSGTYSTNITGSITGTFSKGTTYKIKAYATNGYGTALSSSSFTLIPRSVTFHKNDGSATTSVQYVNDGTATALTANAWSRTGYTFSGWNTNADGKSGSDYADGVNITASGGDVDLYAKWAEKPKYTITLDAGNGTISDANWTNTSGSTYTRTQSNGDESITLPTPSCNCAGWVFKGWSTSSKSNADSFTPDKADGASFTPASNVTYYAVYRQSTPSGTTYNKITSSGDLTSGDYAIVGAYSESGNYYSMKNIINASGYMNEIAFSHATSWTNSDADYIWKVLVFGEKVAFYSADVSKFLTINDDGEWELSTDGQLFSKEFNSTTKAWTFTSSTGYQLTYSTQFYVGNSQNKAIYLYKRGNAESGNYYTSPTCSSLSVTGAASPVAGGIVQVSATAANNGDKVWAVYTIDKNYNFDSWSVSGTGASISSTSAIFTEITVGSADVTVTAGFERKDWHVQWKVNGVELTGSDLGDAQNYYDNDEWATVLPPNPSSCDDGDGASDVFVGWTTNTWGGKSTEPAVLFKNGRDAPVINADVTYHAVFAKESSTTYKRITSTKYIGLDSKIVIVNNSSEKTIKNDYSAVDVSSNLSADDATLSSVSSNWVWTAKDQDEYGYYILKNGDKQLGINKTEGMTSSYSACGNYSTVASSWDLWEASDDSEFNTTTSNCFYIWNWAGDTYFNFLALYNSTTWESKYYANSSSKGNPTASENAMRLYIPEYTNYLISCCTAYDITLTGSGTVDGGTIEADPTSACEGAAVTLAATPSTGYNFTKWIVKDGSADDVTSSVIADGDEDDAYTEMTMPAYDVTVDATFTAKEYTIVLDKNGGTSDGEATATYNSSSLSSVTDASYTNYTLLGYYTESSGGDMVITANGALVAGVEDYTDEDGKWIYDDDDAIFAAHWKPTGTWGVTITAPSNGTITVTYNSGASSMTSGSAYIGGSVTITATGNTGYELATNGLKVNGTTFTSGNSLTLSEDITIAATFSLKKHNVAVTELSTVTISAGDIDEGENDDVNYGTELTLSYSSLTDGHYWSGWKVTNEGGDDVTEDVISGSTLTVPDYNITVTAKIYGDVKAWCIPNFEVTGDVYLTSTAGVYVNQTSDANNLINLSGSDLHNVSKITISYLDENGDVVANASSPLRLYAAAGNTTAESNITSSSFTSGAYNQDYSIRFTVPAATYDKIYNYKLRLQLHKLINGVSTYRVIKTIEHSMNGRALPEEFVIAVKKDNQWFALPNNLASTGSQPSIVPLKITVDDDDTPTAASYAATTTVYKATGRNTEGKYINGIRFTTTGSNWLQTAKADGTYNMWLSESNSDSAQVWYLSSTDFGAYTLKMDTKHNGTKKMGIYTGGYMGFHGSPSASDIYLLPITNKYTDVPATVHEWGEHGAILNATMTDVASATMHVDNGTPADVSLTAVNAASLTAGKYVRVYNKDVTVGDVANEGKQLYVHWKDEGGDEIGVSQILIPRVIASSDEMSDIESRKTYWNTKEVHVLPGVTLTANGNSFSDNNVTINELHIYPGATLNVQDGKLIANTLRLRNGWTRAGDKQYNSARVYIADDAALEKTTASMDYDIYEASDGKHYYPLAVPFTTAVSGIDYADTYLAGFSTYGTHYVIKEYDGANRAKNGEDSDNNWDVVSSESSLVPGKGYIMTAVAVKGEAIIRVPLTFDNGWTSDGEKATYSAVTKNVIAVTAHGGAAATAHQRHKGWNMLGVPFMSSYGNVDDIYGGVGGASLINGELVVNTSADQNMEYQSTTIPYVSVPSHDFAEYVQTDISEAKLLPGWSFFVQVNENGNLTFAVSDRRPNEDNPIYAPRRSEAEEVVRTGIILSGAEASDKTTILVSDRYNGAEYEIGADLEKMFGDGYTLATYSLMNGTRLVYNAMSKAEAQSVIPIGFRTPANGEYTFSLNPRYANAPFERVDLIDYQTGELTNLMTSAYTFTTERTQNDSRFAINVTPIKNTPTDIESTEYRVQSTDIQKVIIDDKMFIIRDGKMYDATGKRVNGK